MLQHITSWPKIIGLFVGGVGFSSMCSAWPVIWSREGIHIGCDWTSLVVGVALLVMSYLLALGYEWARRILLAVIVLGGSVYLVFHGIRLVGPVSISDLPPDQAQVVRLAGRIEELGWFLLVLTAVAFFLLFLSHRDVVAGFRARSRPRPKV
jgi:asparagine N-glycosylation enzyme membrane subunit Stt3